MEEVNQAPVTWRKSTRSNGSGDCIEVADNLAGKVGVRDSKDREGTVLAFEPKAWSRFVQSVKRRKLDH
ncbi:MULTISPECIES: DUF397 domain-containing protein [Micromonospora]|uniref:DUF397 domain-containing protein n=1 Tax=Micromonospora solifontis TaxID=2487138 RepID=A0ABX9WDB6_9ACTN|nr:MULTISPECIES: DUF397 domain-containing protein [Micromonospora]NES13882.1 DUF397 domain-containing protein [Micromonospora sp. PPF5-17B]NES37951.1 DUF397 domain-containing protein [Micromonospora solifontis]NES53982.1 DUF397 domain-containing protein [Micromonospora sp. PPF5-6]RNL97800.1 DUF397 domain-containing protein [Micromonospora solifontis]